MSRKLNRINVSLDIMLEWASGQRQARISDISLGGCFIDTLANLRAGEAVKFMMKVSEGEWMEFAGQVRYALPGFGFGVLFAPLSDEQRSVIEHLILMHNGNPWAGDDRAAA